MEVEKIKMNTKFLRAASVLACLLGLGIVANAQAQQAVPKPVAYTTAPKLVIAKLRNNEQDVHDVRGKVSFTITAANSDDTIVGTLTYSIPDADRQKIAAVSGKALNTVPSTVTQKDVIASFQKATAPPVLHLEINAMDLDVSGLKMRFNRIVLDVNAREGGNVAFYTNEEIEALITVWARQILNGRSRRGVIARMNKVINGEAD